jgi:tetratricopeptide (TPR) repeat protein
MKPIAKLYMLLIIIFSIIIFDIFISHIPKVMAEDNDWLSAGNLLKQKGNYTGAVAVYNKALEIDPKDKQVWVNTGDALNLLANYTEAIAAYNKALEIDPNYVNALDGKGWALNELGNYTQAISY